MNFAMNSIVRIAAIAAMSTTAMWASPAFAAKVTRPGHLAFGADPNGFAVREVTALGAESPNGNTVSLEDQMMRAAEVRQSHDMALGVYRKSLDILRASLGRNR